MTMVLKKRCLAFFNCLAVLCLGGVSGFIFPPFDNACTGYIAFISFLSFLFFAERSKKELFWYSYVFGFAFFAVSFSWINNALLVDEERLGSFVPLTIFAIGSFFGLFWAIPAVVSGFFSNVYSRVLVFAGSFVFMEWVRSFIFTGFPWNLLGTALAFDVRLLQGAKYIGTYGLTLCLLMFCLGLALGIISLIKKPGYWESLAFLLVPLAFVAVAGFSFKSVDDLSGLKVRLVQPSIPQTLKWDKESLYQNFRQYIDLSRKESLDDVDMVVWGETASPYFLDHDVKHLFELQEAIPNNGFLLTGVLRLAMENGEIVPYNSMFVINHEARIKDYYDKAHLVPFGEYLPFRKYLPEFMSPVADIVGDLGQGEKHKNIRVAGLPLMGGAICYESIFPKDVINQKNRPEILVVLANDGWYGISAGPYQHFVAAQMRAIEEGITVIRSGNNGISGVIAPNGEIFGVIGLDEKGVSDVNLPKVLSVKTLYGQYGNVMLLILELVIFFLVWFLQSRCKKCKAC